MFRICGNVGGADGGAWVLVDFKDALFSGLDCDTWVGSEVDVLIGPVSARNHRNQCCANACEKADFGVVYRDFWRGRYREIRLLVKPVDAVA